MNTRLMADIKELLEYLIQNYEIKYFREPNSFVNIIRVDKRKDSNNAH